ncbi:MAG: hypothetical protein QS748_06345 [Candidatus Endonucleobacter bathymodioli]|uniref:RAP domain-containing protein n=1 Tax=Candidatus Endonucleibacter bathymodioli TaxID=539814 RepID=A0AA90NLF9_9GAMM|nr:hypothetical protein [Candidatus Endonucleobacter bathymodioli]
MMFSHKILTQFIFIISTVLLFSYNAYGVHNKHIELTLNSSQIDYNTSHNASSPVTSNIETETCTYNEMNTSFINKLNRSYLNRQKINQLHLFVLKAIKHPARCILTHNVDNIISIFTAANKCQNNKSIMMLAEQIISGNVTVANDIWSCRNIWDISLATSKCSDHNIEYLREVIAGKIVSPNNDMREWKSYHITNELKSLLNGKSNIEEKAFQHIIEHILTKSCNIDTWGGEQLSLLFNSLSYTNTENTKIAMLKVFGAIIKSGLSYWNTKSTSSMFKSLTKMQRPYSADIANEESYQIVLQLIINRLTSTEINFRYCICHNIAFLMNELSQIDELSWLYNVDKVRCKLAKIIVNKGRKISCTAINDWMMMVRGLKHDSDIEREALRTIADCFNDRIVHLSAWLHNQIVDLATKFSHNDGRRIEKAIQKIADFVAKTNLYLWDTNHLEILAKIFSSNTRCFHHNAIDNIASQMIHKSKKLLIDNYINIALILNNSNGDNCLAFIKNIVLKVSDDSFYPSRCSPILLAKLVSILSKEDNKYAEKALNKIANYFIHNNAEQLLSIPPDSLKMLIDGFSKHYKLQASGAFIRHISHIVIDENTDLSDWPIDTMEVILRTLNSSYDDELTQRVFRKIVAQLNLPDTELNNWSIKTLACVAKGVCRLRDYSSEKFITRLAKIYIKKRDHDESKYGITMLIAICDLPIKSRKTIKAAVKLASVLSKNACSNMDTANKVSLFWGITLLNFVVHEEGSKVNPHGKTKDRIVKLTKTIPKIHQDTTPIFDWKPEFINITHSDHAHKSSHISVSKYDNKSTSVLEDSIHKLIKTTIPSVNIDNNCCINKFPVDLFLRSGSKSLLIEVDGPHHFFKYHNNILYSLAKDRFVDFVFEKKMDYEIMRINYEEENDDEHLKQFIQQILDIFPDYTH